MDPINQNTLETSNSSTDTGKSFGSVTIATIIAVLSATPMPAKNCSLGEPILQMNSESHIKSYQLAAFG